MTTGCPSPPRRPVAPEGATYAIDIRGGSLRGVAGDATLVYSAVTAGDTSTIEAHRGDAIAWTATFAGTAGPIVRAGDALVIALAGTDTVAGVAMRGRPGAVVVALDAATGVVRWKLAIDANEWAAISALAAVDDDGAVIAGGSFAGTLRTKTHVVSSGGRSDGFVAKLTATGEVAWVMRTGGPHADAVQGVATAPGRIAIAGTFATGADLLGEPLVAFDDKTPAGDGFVAELDPSGARKWSATFGGKLDDSVAGVAIDGKGRVVVAANARDAVRIAGTDLLANGLADGLVAWWSADGSAGAAALVGGSDFDGLRGITASGDRVVVGGFFSGALRLGDRIVNAGGGDDAFLAAFDGTTLSAAWPVGGEGREEIAALAPVPGGFMAGIAHTARAHVADDPLPASGGAAIVVRAIR